VTKLFGYDYDIIYNKGKENVVVDTCFQGNMKKKGDAGASSSTFNEASGGQLSIQRACSKCFGSPRRVCHLNILKEL
jgi:hypothetical protein